MLRLRVTQSWLCALADLGPAGEIIFEGQFFKSPSAFSVFVKRKVRGGTPACVTLVPFSFFLGKQMQTGNPAFDGAQVNPSRKADDGWTSCKYRGAVWHPEAHGTFVGILGSLSGHVVVLGLNKSSIEPCMLRRLLP